MSSRRIIVALSAALLLAGVADARSLRELQFLEDSHTHAILHAAPARDPDSDRRWRQNECSPQEDLTGFGRLLAVALGDRIQKAGTRVDHVVASPDCNGVVTAGLLELVPVDVREFLASDPPGDVSAEDQRDEALFYLARLRPSETALLVTHGQNIAALTGLETVPGELLIVTVDSLGQLEVRFSIAP